MRFLRFDFKRLFSGKALMLLCLLSPILVVFIFTSVVSPMIYTAKGLHFNLAIFDEDGSEAVSTFITQMLNSQALLSLVDAYPVKSAEDGLALIESGEVSVLIHVPEGLFEKMRSGQAVQVKIISTKAHALEANLSAMALTSALEIVGKSQNVMEAARQILRDKGVSDSDADSYLSNATETAIKRYMTRREAMGNGGPVSPLGEFLPVEYYISAIFVLFAALAMLPLIHFTAADSSGAILRRGLLCGIGTGRFFMARIVSGTTVVFLVLTMLFPTALLLKLGDTVLGGTYANNLVALALALVLTALCFSALALAIAVWLPNENTALWAGFFLVLGMAAFCGALIPEGALPGWVSGVGRWLPLRSSMRLLSLSLFHYDSGLYKQDALKLFGFSALLLPLGYLGLWKRGRRI